MRRGRSGDGGEGGGVTEIFHIEPLSVFPPQIFPSAQSLLFSPLRKDEDENERRSRVSTFYSTMLVRMLVKRDKRIKVDATFTPLSFSYLSQLPQILFRMVYMTIIALNISQRYENVFHNNADSLYTFMYPPALVSVLILFRVITSYTNSSHSNLLEIYIKVHSNRDSSMRISTI